MEQKETTLEEARQELVSLLNQRALTPYSNLTFEEAKELVSRVRGYTQIRTQIYLAASAIKKGQGIWVRANVDGKPFSFRNINEFICYFEKIDKKPTKSEIVNQLREIKEFNVEDKSYPLPTW